MFLQEGMGVLLFLLTAAFLPLATYRVIDGVARGFLQARLEDTYRVHVGGFALLSTLILLLFGLQVVGADIPRLVGLPFLVVIAVFLAMLEETKQMPTQFALSFRFMIGAVAYMLGFGFAPAVDAGWLPHFAAVLVDFSITVFFYVSVLYTVSLLDSLRGLASGIVVIVSLTLMSLMARWGAGGDTFLLPLTLAAICVGHLLLLGSDRRIQLGSVGQVLAGVMLAASTVSSRTWGATMTMLFVPLIACSVPIAERIFSTVALMRSGETAHSPAHLHKYLLKMGFRDSWVILILWAVTLHIGVMIHLVYASGSALLAVAVGASLALVVLLPGLFLLFLADRTAGEREPGKLRILFFSHYFAPEVNAPASRLYEHAKRWVREGHQVTVVCPVPSAPHGWPYKGYRNSLWVEENIDGIRVIRIWTFMAANRRRIRRTLNYVSYLGSSLLALLFIRRHDVMVSTSPQFFCGLVGAVGSLYRRERFVLEVRDIWPESIEAVGAGKKKALLAVISAIARWMYARADHIVTVGDGYRDKLLEIGAAPPEGISVIPNGIDFEIFDRIDSAAASGRFRELGIEGRFVISYVGTVGMAHGLGTLLDAAESLRDTRPDVAFLVVGDGAERRALQDNAEARGLSNVVFAGLVPKADVPGLLALSSATLVHLRKTELFKTVLPSKLFEGMALSRPVLLGVRGCAQELVQRADAGLCFEPENAPELCDAIARLSSDPANATRMGANGRRFVAAEFNREHLAVEYTNVLAKVASEHRTKRETNWLTQPVFSSAQE